MFDLNGKIKLWVRNWRWKLIALFANNEPVIMNCTFNCDALKDGWSLFGENNQDKSLIRRV